jgi:hypothetical protein
VLLALLTISTAWLVCFFVCFIILSFFVFLIFFFSSAFSILSFIIFVFTLLSLLFPHLSPTEFIFPNLSPTEFTALDQWVREYQIYAKVKMIPIFRKYKMWKLYTLWRKNVRNKKMSKAMNSLKNSLFILHPKISVALLQIRNISYSIGALRLCKFKESATYPLSHQSLSSPLLISSSLHLSLHLFISLLIWLPVRIQIPFNHAQILPRRIRTRAKHRKRPIFGRIQQIVPKNSRNSTHGLRGITSAGWLGHCCRD